MKNNKFELQLVVIGILITAYLQIIPSLFSSGWANQFGVMTFNIIMWVSYTIGAFWFLTLLLGTSSLIRDYNFDSEVIMYFYNRLFKFTCISSLMTFIFWITIYTYYPLYFLMKNYSSIISILIICIILISIIILIIKTIKKGGKKND